MLQFCGLTHRCAEWAELQRLYAFSMTSEHPQWDEYQMRLKAEQNEKDEKARIEAEIQEWGAQEATELVKEMESAMATATRSAFEGLQAVVERATASLDTMNKRSVALEVRSTLTDPLHGAKDKLRALKAEVAGDVYEAATARMRLALVANELEGLSEVLKEAGDLDERFEDISGDIADVLAPFGEVRKQVEDAAVALQGAMEDDALTESLQGMGKPELLAHATLCRETRQRLEVAEAELEELRAYKKDKEAEQQAAAHRVAASAASLPSIIGKALQRQITYTGPRLKHSSKQISYTCGGVSAEVFCQAFRTSGKTASVSGEELGVRGKSLRYGAMLDLVGFVNIRLSGDQLTATAKYSMGSGGGFGFGGFRW